LHAPGYFDDVMVKEGCLDAGVPLPVVFSGLLSPALNRVVMAAAPEAVRPPASPPRTPTIIVCRWCMPGTAFTRGLLSSSRASPVFARTPKLTGRSTRRDYWLQGGISDNHKARGAFPDMAVPDGDHGLEILPKTFACRLAQVAIAPIERKLK
jgi:hypothetical protein